jgi:hypothetical protein
MEKSKAIRHLIDKLSLEENKWEIKDYWEGDLCAIGVIKQGNNNRLAYISSYNRENGKYYYEMEINTGSEETDFRVIGKGEDVDFETLFEVIKSHLD